MVHYPVRFRQRRDGPAVLPVHRDFDDAQPRGSYFRYSFMVSTTLFPDYGKFGLWPCGYYGTFRNFLTGVSYDSVGTVVFERSTMLQGLPSQMVQFTLSGVPDLMLPSSLDGQPPPVGAPNNFLLLGMPMTRYEFHVDWANPANSTFGLGSNHAPNQAIPVASLGAQHRWHPAGRYGSAAGYSEQLPDVSAAVP